MLQAKSHRRIWLSTGLLLVILAGCGRRHFLRQADRETYDTLAEKTSGFDWAPSPDYSVYPDPRSRFADPTDPAFPQLPPAGPRLYKSGFLEDAKAADPGELEPVDRAEPPGGTGDELPAPRPADLGLEVQGVGWWSEYQAGEDKSAEDEARDPLMAWTKFGRAEQQLRVVPVAKEDWDALPESCRRWMLEFESVREEYEATYERRPDQSERVAAPRLTLNQIMRLALIHSREYQTQKETLYRAALRLTLERYDYALRFDPFSNGAAPNYLHNRSSGFTVNSLAIPTTAAGSKILATGGDLVARFANDVLLTFNGPSGFSADVGSQLVLQLSQSILQRDIVFENLTQAERNVIYAARDFGRFRKTFFSGLANRYYSLLLTYRTIAIGSQDYFSNARAFHQGQAEHQANRLPRFQVDQFEQNALRSLSGLIRSCNTLERSLDDFKLQIGLPPELLIHVDLGELDRLTGRDEATVREELVRRARRNLIAENRRSAPDPAVLLSQGTELVKRLIALEEARRASGEEDALPVSREALDRLTALHEANEAWYVVWQTEQVQKRTLQSDSPVVQRFQRTMEVVDAIRNALAKEVQMRQAQGETQNESWRRKAFDLFTRERKLLDSLAKAVADRRLDEIEGLAKKAARLLSEVESLATDLRRIQDKNWADEKWLRQQVKPVLDICDQVLSSGSGGLSDIEIAHDDALLTAVAHRWDLANQREQVADSWRQIKYTADRLRSVLDVTASQTVRTPGNVNRVFDFGWDDSTTNLRLNFDTPFNRQSERNAYRRALISYQAALRAWIQAEDRVKRDVRDDLRRLVLDRQQYAIAVASAALAQERVVSTRLQLALGIGNVAARDFLEAQQAYTASLNAVAAEHIGFLTDRIALFLDMEQLAVDNDGFWPALYDDSYKPEADYRLEMSGPSPYGQLAPGVFYSKRLRAMLQAPVLAPTVEEETITR